MQLHRRTSGFILAGIIALAAAGPAFAQRGPATPPPITAAPYHSNGIYDVGEKVGWTVTVAPGAPAPTGKYAFTVRRNNAVTIATGELDLTSGKANLETSLNEPGMLYVQLTPPPAPPAAAAPASDAGAAPAGGGAGGGAGRGGGRAGRGGGGGMTLGAAVAPDKIKPSAPRPADFDTFWDAKLKAAADVPFNPVLTPVTQGAPEGVELYMVQLDTAGGHAQGYLAKPKKEGKFPAICIYEWAGVHVLNTSSVTTLAAMGFIAFNVESHDMKPNEATAPNNYTSIGNNDKEKSYFVPMYIRDSRAVDYMTSRPDWDGKIMALRGTSMGGQQSFATAGLNPKVTHLMVLVPAGSDTNAQLHERQEGYPNFPNNPQVMETALYVDPTNFAQRINATCLVSMGFIDTIAPAIGIWSTFNQIKGPHEAAPMRDAAHNNQSTAEQMKPFTDRETAWLKALAAGEAVKVNTDVVKPKP